MVGFERELNRRPSVAVCSVVLGDALCGLGDKTAISFRFMFGDVERVVGLRLNLKT